MCVGYPQWDIIFEFDYFISLVFFFLFLEEILQTLCMCVCSVTIIPK